MKLDLTAWIAGQLDDWITGENDEGMTLILPETDNLGGLVYRSGPVLTHDDFRDLGNSIVAPLSADVKAMFPPVVIALFEADDRVETGFSDYPATCWWDGGVLIATAYLKGEAPDVR